MFSSTDPHPWGPPASEDADRENPNEEELETAASDESRQSSPMTCDASQEQRQEHREEVEQENLPPMFVDRESLNALREHRRQTQHLLCENEDGSRDWKRILQPIHKGNSQEQARCVTASSMCAPGRWDMYQESLHLRDPGPMAAPDPQPPHCIRQADLALAIGVKAAVSTGGNEILLEKGRVNMQRPPSQSQPQRGQQPQSRSQSRSHPQAQTQPQPPPAPTAQNPQTEIASRPGTPSQAAPPARRTYKRKDEPVRILGINGWVEARNEPTERRRPLPSQQWQNVPHNNPAPPTLPLPSQQWRNLPHNNPASSPPLTGGIIPPSMKKRKQEDDIPQSVSIKPPKRTRRKKDEKAEEEKPSLPQASTANQTQDQPTSHPSAAARPSAPASASAQAQAHHQSAYPSFAVPPPSTPSNPLLPLQTPRTSPAPPPTQPSFSVPPPVPAQPPQSSPSLSAPPTLSGLPFPQYPITGPSNSLQPHPSLYDPHPPYQSPFPSHPPTQPSYTANIDYNAPSAQATIHNFVRATTYAESNTLSNPALMYNSASYLNPFDIGEINFRAYPTRPPNTQGLGSAPSLHVNTDVSRTMGDGRQLMTPPPSAGVPKGRQMWMEGMERNLGWEGSGE